jgi:hypothetical protein
MTPIYINIKKTFLGNQGTVNSNTTTLITNSNNKDRAKKPTTEYKVSIQKHKNHSNKIH